MEPNNRMQLAAKIRPLETVIAECSSVVLEPVIRNGQHIFMRALCPFCNAEKKEFTTSIPKQIFYCFDCAISGDSICFIARYHKLTFRNAAEFLLEKYHVEEPKEED
jgi:DNA primase